MYVLCYILAAGQNTCSAEDAYDDNDDALYLQSSQLIESSMSDCYKKWNSLESNGKYL